MNKSNQIAKTTLMIMIFSLLSKLLGFFREVLIAAKLGSGMETDTFFVAIMVTGLISSLISVAISTTFMPVLFEIDLSEGTKGKVYHTNNMINITFVLSILLVILGWITSPILVRVLAKGFYGEQYDLAISLTRIGLPMILFSGGIAALTGFLQSEQRHNSTSMIGIPFNLIYIMFLLFMSTTCGIKGLMIAAVLAILSQFLIQLPEARMAGYKYKFIFNIKDKYIRKVLLLSLPVFIGIAINDLNAIVDKTLASDLIPGSISALNYANKLNGLILSVFISAITTVIFPLLSKESNNDNIPGMKKIMGKGINLLLIITVPATIGLIVLSTPIVQVAFERGEFDAGATLMTSQALVFYSIGLVAMSLRLLLTRVYYSLQDTKTPMVNGAISVGFNIVLNIILVKYMAHAGLALATSIATTIATILLLFGLKKKIGSLGTKAYITTFLKTGLASGVMGLVAYFMYHGLYRILGVSKLYNLISLLVAVGVGAIVYGVLCYVFKVEEVRDLVRKIKERLLI